MMKTQAVAYCRVSSEEQAQEGVSLDMQEARIRAYCTMRGFELVEVIIDPAVSAGKEMAARPGGQRLLGLLKSKQANAVIALKLDRLFRDCANCLTTVQRWDKASVALHLLDLGGQAVDTSSAFGKFFLTVMAGAAELERNQIRERTAAAMRHKASRGEYCGGQAPYGSSVQDGLLVTNDDERAVIGLLRRWRGGGMSIRACTRELAERRIHGRTGRPMGFEQVRRILACRT